MKSSAQLNYLNVDYRIGSKELLPHLLRLGANAQETSLDFGDFNFVGIDPFTKEPTLVGIERKRVSDFVSSMREDRLGVQAAGMVELYPYRYLIIEEPFRAGLTGELEVVRWSKSKPTAGKFGPGEMEHRLWCPMRPSGKFGVTRVVTVAEFYSYLNSLNRIAGLQVIKSESIQDTAYWLYYLWKWWQKSSHTSLGVDGLGDVFDCTPVIGGMTRPTLAMRMAASIDGIGPKRARAVGKFFRTPKRMILAQAQDWSKIEFKSDSGRITHIGPEIANRIIREMKGEKA